MVDVLLTATSTSGKTALNIGEKLELSDVTQFDSLDCSVGLFQRAILLSGSSLSPWELIQEPTKYALDLARQLNCSNSMDSPTSLLKCLREIPLTELMKITVETPEFLQAFGKYR